MYNKKQKTFLLQLARKAIVNHLESGNTLKINEEEIDAELREKRGVFVTLTGNGNLRGCIGHLVPIQPLYLDVIDNAVNSAFDDPRFNPLDADELENIKIEISVLSLPEPLEYKDAADLLNKLVPLKHGVILKKGFYQATYLPQVWEDLSDKELFLSSLCQKAGLYPDEWKTAHPDIQVYTVEKFEE